MTETEIAFRAALPVTGAARAKTRGRTLEPRALYDPKVIGGGDPDRGRGLGQLAALIGVPWLIYHKLYLALFLKIRSVPLHLGATSAVVILLLGIAFSWYRDRRYWRSLAVIQIVIVAVAGTCGFWIVEDGNR
jgi:hypothetical protein